MIDPVALPFAVVGVFKSCLSCFQNIRLGKRFGKDFGICLAKLEAAEVRLTRWAEPIGLLEEKLEIKGPYEDRQITKAYEWLGKLQDAFEEARETSEKYTDKQKRKGKQENLEPLDEDEALRSEASIGKLVTSMRTIAKERQKHLNLPRKITWALYGKDSFDALIEEIVTMTNDLVELFPSTQPRLQELCQREVSSLDNETVLNLAKVLRNDDEKSDKSDDSLLSKAICNHIESHRHDFRNIKVDGNGVHRFGDEYAFESGVKPGDIKADGMDIQGSGFTHTGHVFYGKYGAQGMHSYGQKPPDITVADNPSTDNV